MDDADVVDVVERRRKLGEPGGQALLVRLPRFEVRQRARTPVLVQHEVHDEIRAPPVFEEIEVEDAREVRMAKAGKGLPLGKKALPEELDAPVVEREDLQRTMRAERSVLGLVHGPHAALSERTDNAVRPNHVLCGEGHQRSTRPA